MNLFAFLLSAAVVVGTMVCVLPRDVLIVCATLVLGMLYVLYVSLIVHFEGWAYAMFTTVVLPVAFIAFWLAVDRGWL
ncbi:hypothetical protein [Variovorax sp. JS1663]|uniref:hypothetical protein n=1 Tax=Variovorax sp. JS1663 TaxID=1851577 RepID=UPI000B3413C9|nr:hypothetical protein [Variovorax sp. JS1663]OUM00564.1 hypothetical protein A8M77_21085 [Variovorax sp. JS1663]